jgi:hypothetical protein
MSTAIEPFPDGIESIAQLAKATRLRLPRKTVIIISEYASKILLQASFIGKTEKLLPIFISKSVKDIAKFNQAGKDLNTNVIGLEKDETHFWFNIKPDGAVNDRIISNLKEKQIDNFRSGIIVSATWDGAGSALMPSLISQLKEWSIKPVALALLPSRVQPMDGQFNMLASVGTCALKDLTTLLLVDRENLEGYMGVDRNGSIVSGNVVANYLIDLMLSKENLPMELEELSKLSDNKMFTVFLTTGASLKIYGSIENIVNSALLKPFLTFDLSTSQVLYALIRMPIHLKEKVTKGKIELAIANSFQGKADLKSILVAEPIYIQENNDRFDIALLVGGFDTIKMFSPIEERVQPMKDRAVKENYITNKEWLRIVAKVLGRIVEEEPEPITQIEDDQLTEMENTIIQDKEDEFTQIYEKAEPDSTIIRDEPTQVKDEPTLMEDESTIISEKETAPPTENSEEQLVAVEEEKKEAELPTTEEVEVKKKNVELTQIDEEEKKEQNTPSQ